MGEQERRGNELVEIGGDSITTLSPKLQRFVHLYMTGQYTHQKLSQLLEVHPNTISNWLKRGDVKEIIADMQTTSHQIVGIQLKSMSSKAVNRLLDLMDSPIDGVALQAVKDVLDRGGHKPKQEINVNKKVVTFEEKLQSIMEDTINDEDIIDMDEFEDVGYEEE